MEQEAVSNANQDQVSNQENLNDVVKYETHQKLLGQHKKTKEQFNEVLGELEKYKQAEKQKEQMLLEEHGKFDEVKKLKDERIKKLELDLQERTQREANVWKLQAFHNKLPGKIKHNDYLAHAEIDKILYDESNMSCDEDSVNAVVNNFLEKHSHLVESAQKAKLPNQSPNSNINLANKIDNNKTPADALRESVANMFGS